MKLSNLIKPIEFMRYFIIGGVATVIDWSIFWVFTNPLNIHYQLSLTSGFLAAAIFHYTANKWITFDCQSKKIGSQFSLYFFVAILSLLCSIGVMAFFVSYLGLNKFYARMLTTALILFPNYFLHKNITFNKRIFLQPETP